MSLSEEIIEAIRARVARGETYDQIAASCGISHAHIHRLANRRQDPMKMRLDSFFSLFPSAQISLAGSAAFPPACSSSELERVRMEAERDRLAHERRELELERRIFELEKELAERERPRTPRDERPEHPYRAGLCISSGSSD